MKALAGILSLFFWVGIPGGLGLLIADSSDWFWRAFGFLGVMAFGIEFYRRNPPCGKSS